MSATGPLSFGAFGAVLLSLSQVRPSVGTPVAPTLLGPPCPDAIVDQSGGPCLQASSIPTPGMLFPGPHTGGANNVQSGSLSFVGCGSDNEATGAFSAVAGGRFNAAWGPESFIGGGQGNFAGEDWSTVGGGATNYALGPQTTVAGGYFNFANDIRSAIGGGSDNWTEGEAATIAGGGGNITAADYATVPGGLFNKAYGKYSFAAGRRARADHEGSFVWGDSADLYKQSSAADQFNVYARGGTRVFAQGTAPAVTVAPDGKVGIGIADPTHRLSVAGEICASGSIGSCSDARFKTRIEPVEDALEIVERLRAVRFDWRRDEFPDRRFEEGRQLGFVAQEIAQVVPEVVSEGGDGALAVDYGKLSSLLAAALQEQQAQIDELREQVRRLEERGK